jgi:serine/threonine-protein kinase
MPADPRVQQLLDQMIDSGATAEEVCRPYPELLPEIREHCRRMDRVRAELDALFPPGTVLETSTPPFQDNGVLPRVPGYEVEAVLGQGGVGVVFRARNLRLARPVALKMLLAGAYAGPTELARFQREAEAVASLCHPNLVQIYEVGDHEAARTSRWNWLTEAAWPRNS